MKFMKRLKIMPEETLSPQLCNATSNKPLIMYKKELRRTPTRTDSYKMLTLKPKKKNSKNLGLPPKPFPLSQMDRDSNQKTHGKKLKLIINQTNQALTKIKRSKSHQSRFSSTGDISNLIERDDEQSSRCSIRRPINKYSQIGIIMKQNKENSTISKFAFPRVEKDSSKLDISEDSVSSNSARQIDILKYDTRQSLWRKNILV